MRFDFLIKFELKLVKNKSIFLIQTFERVFGFDIFIGFRQTNNFCFVIYASLISSAVYYISFAYVIIYWAAITAEFDVLSKEFSQEMP